MKNLSIIQRFPQLQTLTKEQFPHHVLIIPDGNGRWAQQSHFPITWGHKKGADAAKQILLDLSELQEIRIVTIWGFSSDNWKRSMEEINGLFDVIHHSLNSLYSILQQKHAKLFHLGRKDRIPQSLKDEIEHMEKESEKNPGQTVCIAIDFGGEDQIRRMLEKARNLPKGTEITEETVWSLRDGEGKIPPADLLIRTAGEHRTSDIGWLNNAGTELFFIDKYFPDVTTEDIIDAILSFARRQRRFGARPAIPENHESALQ